MISKIIWELREDRSIRKVTKLTNRLYANSKASAEYNLISDAILPTDTVKMILTVGEKEYHKLLAYGNVLLETGETVKGWSIVSNGEELAVEIEDNGYETMIVSFEIKRFSTLDSQTLLTSFTSPQDTVLIYASSSYTPMVEPTDAELLENEISKINVKIDELENVDADLYNKKVDKFAQQKNDDKKLTTTTNINNTGENIFLETSAEYDNTSTQHPNDIYKASMNIFGGSILLSASEEFGEKFRTTIELNSATAYLEKDNVVGEIATNNDIENAKTIVRAYVDEKIESVKKSAGYVFDTFANFINWLTGDYIREDGVLPSKLNIGDDIFIVEEGIPDYWVKSKSEPMGITNFAPYESGDYKPTITWLED